MKLKYLLGLEKEKNNFTKRVIKPKGRRTYPPCYTTNKVDNMKYGFLFFIPKFFYQQFKYFFNFYYLCLCVSQFFPSLKIGFLFTYITPLAFVVILTFLGELNDEIRRFCRDLEFNRRKVM